MDGKMNMEVEGVYEKLGIGMPYKIMCKYYSGMTLYKRMLVDIIMKKWKPKIKVDIDIEMVRNKMDMDDSNGKVYKIVSENSNAVYIGSTIFEIEDRLRKHMLDYEFYDKYKYHYCSSYEVLKSGKCSVLLLEDNIGKNELLVKESKYINDNLDRCVNLVDPLSRRRIFEKDEENKKREIESRKYMIKLVCQEINDGNVKIESMEDMYLLYMKKYNEILCEKRKMDEEYYGTLIEFYRLRNINV